MQKELLNSEALISLEKPKIFEAPTPKNSWNMISKNLKNNSIDYFNFDETDYSYRQFAYDDTTSYSFNSSIKPLTVQEIKCNNDSTVMYTKGYNPKKQRNKLTSTLSQGGIIGSDDRVLVKNPEEYPYSSTGALLIVYNNVYNNKLGKYESLYFSGTAFLEGPDILVTAGHCVYGDVSSTYTDSNGNTDTSYEDNLSNPRFADQILFYPGQNGPSLPYGSVSIDRVYIEKQYYLNRQKDWACCKLSKAIGNTVGWLGKISNYYKKDSPMTTFGYPADKNGYMYETTGKMIGMESNGWNYMTDMDNVGGQSGSPYQIKYSTDDFVCGIATFYVGNAYTGGCRIDSFMFAFMNSFVTGDELPEYLTLFVASKKGSTWKIRIYNPNKFKVRAYYNSKMCFYDDAKNWSGLGDVKNLEIYPEDDVYVDISENWFATTIAVSIKHESKRLVSFADNLNKDDNSLSLYQNLIVN